VTTYANTSGWKPLLPLHPSLSLSLSLAAGATLTFTLTFTFTFTFTFTATLTRRRRPHSERSSSLVTRHSSLVTRLRRVLTLAAEKILRYPYLSRYVTHLRANDLA